MKMMIISTKGGIQGKILLKEELQYPTSAVFTNTVFTSAMMMISTKGGIQGIIMCKEELQYPISVVFTITVFTNR